MIEGPAQNSLEPRACPFVALADDRDRRSELPDPRHRCYAEPDPQPRAEAHQRTYCLAAAFAACPIFLDWAARAAADPVASQRGGPTMAQLARPTESAPRPRTGDSASRGWAAPPPWAAHDQQARPVSDDEQLAVFPDPSDDQDPDRDLIGTYVAAEPPPAGVVFEPPRAAAAAEPSRPSEPPRIPQGAPLASPMAGGVPRQARPAPVSRLDDRPEWSRSGRRETYPTVGRGVGLRHIPLVLAAIAGVVITGLAIFLLVGFLGQSGTTLPTVRRESPTPTASPTPTPSPSPLTYTVQSGDTLEAIARNFGLTVEQVACANGITDVNVLQVDQVLIIPDDGFACPGSGEPSPSPS